MDVIEKSPYEWEQDAEKEEELFERMDDILADEDEGEDASPSKTAAAAIRVFGPTNGRALVRAYGEYMWEVDTTCCFVL